MIHRRGILGERSSLTCLLKPPHNEIIKPYICRTQNDKPRAVPRHQVSVARDKRLVLPSYCTDLVHIFFSYHNFTSQTTTMAVLFNVRGMRSQPAITRPWRCLELFIAVAYVFYVQCIRHVVTSHQFKTFKPQYKFRTSHAIRC